MRVLFYSGHLVVRSRTYLSFREDDKFVDNGCFSQLHFQPALEVTLGDETDSLFHISRQRPIEHVVASSSIVFYSHGITRGHL